MKKLVVKHLLQLVKEFYPDYDEDQLDEIRYGIEAIYLTITKIIVILLLSLVLGYFKETMIILLLFNVLRFSGFGLHASKSWMCWVSSILVFIVIPILCKNFIVSDIILIVLASICIICFLFFAPADTKSRPMLNKKRRLIRKICTTVSGIIYLILLITTKDSFINNALVASMLIQTILILPITYKLFKLPYNNYRNCTIQG